MSDTIIKFDQIPASWQVPGSYIEVKADYQRTGILPMPARTLIMGQATATATGTAGVVYPDITRVDQATALAGFGSHIEQMARAYLAVNESVPLDIMIVADAGGSTKATWTLTFTAAANPAGTVAVAIGGQRVQIGTAAGDTAAQIATAFAAAINADKTLPVISTGAVAGVVTITARHPGTTGNDISVIQNPAVGDALPSGVTLVVASTVTGATDPLMAAPLAAIMDLWYTDIIIPWQASTVTSAIAAELVRRYNAMVHMDGRCHFGATGTLSQIIGKAAALNSPFMFLSGLTAPGSPPWVIAATAGGICAQKLLDDPARQLLDLGMPGVVGSQPVNLFDDSEKQLLLAGGCSVFKRLRDGSIAMQRYVSTYTVDANGSLDPAYHDIMEVAVASRIRYDWRAYFRDVYPNNKLAPDDSLAADRDPTVCTPRRAHGTWTARLLTYAANGWVVDEKTLAREAVFVIDPNDRNRLNYRLPYKRIGNLMVDAGQLLFQV